MLRTSLNAKKPLAVEDQGLEFLSPRDFSEQCIPSTVLLGKAHLLEI